MAIYTIQLKRGKAASWSSLNLVLNAGEPGYEIDTGKLKIGNGSTAWNDLPYLGEDKALIVNADTYHDFPAIGETDVLYKASQEKQLYQWNENDSRYELLLSNNLVSQEQLQDALNRIEIPEISLENYVTKQEVADAIAAIPKVDLDPYALKSELPDITGLASEEYVVQKIAEAELDKDEVDLSAYYTKDEVDAAIDSIKHPIVDLEPYATKEELREAVNSIQIPSVDGLASEEFVEEKIAEIVIPDTTNLATKSYVDEAIANIEHLPVDLTGLATEEYVAQKIAEAKLAGGEVDLSEYYTKAEVDDKFNELVIPELPDLSDFATKEEIPNVEGLATETYVQEQINAIEHPQVDLSDYVTEQFVTDAIAAIPEAKADVNVYEITSNSTALNELITLLPEGIEINQGDVMLVTNELGVKSAYQFDDSWIACDGNVDASKVIMPFDITLAGSYTQVGNLSKTSTGTATFATKGKSVAAALQEILSKREQPKIKSNPSVSLTASSGAKEVGTKITPEWSASLNAGSYTYGPATGITASSWEISDTDGNTASTANGEFAEITVGDSTNYRITAKANYAAGAIAKDNLGDSSNPTVQIAAGSKSANGGYITGYRAWFMYVGEDLSSIDSAFIRAGSNKGSTIETQNGIAIPAGTKRVIVAIPSTSTLELTQVIDVDGMGLDVFGNFTLSSVNVEGLNNYEAKAYNVWVAENVNGMAATHYNFIIG